MGNTYLVIILLLVLLPLSAVIVLMKRRFNAMSRRMAASYRGRIVLGPQDCIFRGADSGYEEINGAGLICATDSLVVFEMFDGTRMEIPRSEIADITEEEGFRGEGAGRHMVIHTWDSNRIGFLMRDARAWKERLMPGG